MDILKELKSCFHYDKNTGIFTRLNRKNSNGSLDKDGYLILKIKGKQYKAHRMAWLYVFGKFPEYTIDHINHNRTDNRIVNLRDINHLENLKNTIKHPNKDTGIIGVYLDKCTKGLKSKFVFRKQGKTYRFRTLKEAILAK